MSSPRRFLDIQDFKSEAHRRVPRMFYDYVDSGSWSEQTYRANEFDLKGICLNQRVGLDISTIKTNSYMMGTSVTMPAAIAPIGLAGMQYADGEILMARAAERFGIRFTLSTMSICSLEDISQHTSSPFWFQLYVMKDRGFVKSLIERARLAGCEALVLTLDLQRLGQRHKDIRNGLTAPPDLTFNNILSLVSKPSWCANMLSTRRRSFGNIIGFAPGVSNLSDLSSWTKEQFDTSFTWKDIEWIKSTWNGPLILKGIMHPEDANYCSDYGADAVVVSNHGGRQLDGAPSSIKVLPRISAALSDCETKVLFDGGIRSGQDLFRALAVGADGVLLGRAVVYGLAANGEFGVFDSLEIIQKELESTMAFCGCTNTEDIGSSTLHADYCH